MSAPTLDRPLVTIGITAYNAAGTLAAAVRSALTQTWRPIEVVVVDDASDDDTPGLLDHLEARHPEVRAFRQPENGGVAVARNRIIKEARGEFVAFFDDDDESRPGRVARQLRRIIDYEQAFADGGTVICHTARTQHYPGGGVHVISTMGTQEGQAAPAGWRVAERVLIGTPLENGYGACATCSQMARTSTYRALGGFDPAFRRSEDSELVIRLAKAGGHFVGIAEPLVDQAMTRTSDKSLAEDMRFLFQVLAKHRDVADRHGLYEFCRGWLEVKQAWLQGRRLRFLTEALRVTCGHPRHSFRRFLLATPNRRLNRAFGRFYGETGEAS